MKILINMANLKVLPKFKFKLMIISIASSVCFIHLQSQIKITFDYCIWLWITKDTWSKMFSFCCTKYSVTFCYISYQLLWWDMHGNKSTGIQNDQNCEKFLKFVSLARHILIIFVHMIVTHILFKIWRLAL